MLRTMQEGWIKIAFLCFICMKSLVWSTTDRGDCAILDEFRKGLSNAELLQWPTKLASHLLLRLSGCSDSSPEHGVERASTEGLQQALYADQCPPPKEQFQQKVAIFQWFVQSAVCLPWRPPVLHHSLGFLRSPHLFAGFILGEETPESEHRLGFALGFGDSVQLMNVSLVQCNLAGELPEFLGSMSSFSSLKLS